MSAYECTRNVTFDGGCGCCQRLHTGLFMERVPYPRKVDMLPTSVYSKGARARNDHLVRFVDLAFTGILLEKHTRLWKHWSPLLLQNIVPCNRTCCGTDHTHMVQLFRQQQWRQARAYCDLRFLSRELVRLWINPCDNNN